MTIRTLSPKHVGTNKAQEIIKANTEEVAAAAGIDQAVVDSAATAITLALTHGNKYIRTSAATTVTVTIPLQATVAFPVGFRCRFRQQGLGQIVLAGATGAVVLSPTGAVKTAARYDVIELQKTADNNWDIFGDNSSVDQ